MNKLLYRKIVLLRRLALKKAKCTRICTHTKYVKSHTKITLRITKILIFEKNYDTWYNITDMGVNLCAFRNPLYSLARFTIYKKVGVETRLLVTIAAAASFSIWEVLDEFPVSFTRKWDNRVMICMNASLACHCSFSCSFNYLVLCIWFWNLEELDDPTE